MVQGMTNIVKGTITLDLALHLKRVAATVLNTSAQSFSKFSRSIQTHSNKEIDLTSAMDSGTLKRGTLAATFAGNLSEVYEKKLTKIEHI